MTNNQIQYWRLMHDRANLRETQRHNVVSERQNEMDLSEKSRHNRAAEEVSTGSLAESQRHNQAQERLDIGKLAETSRHNVVDEAIKQFSNATNRFAAQATASVRRDELSEQQRSNRTKESETERHNRSTEALEEFRNVVQQVYNNAMIEDRAQGRELEAQELEDQWNEWTRQYEFNREKWATELDKWQRDRLVDNIHWGVGELSDIFQSFLRGQRK